MKAQLHDEIKTVRSQREAAELEKHKLVLDNQTEAAATHVRVSREGKEKEKGRVKGGGKGRRATVYIPYEGWDCC